MRLQEETLNIKHFGVPELKYGVSRGSGHDSFDGHSGYYDPKNNTIYFPISSAVTPDTNITNILNKILNLSGTHNIEETIHHELGHFYIDKLHESMGLGNWPIYPEECEKTPENLATRLISEGISEYFYRTIHNEDDDFQDTDWPMKIEDFWKTDIIYNGSYHLVKPIIDRFGQKGIEYLILNLPTREDFNYLPGYQEKVMKVLAQQKSLLESKLIDERVPNEFLRALERELGLHEDWIKEWVEENYNDGISKRMTKLSICEDPLQEEYARIGVIGHETSYDRTTDTLNFPFSGGTEKVFKTIKHLHHELWHSMHDYDDFNSRKGLIYSEGYSGPSIDEIQKHYEMKVSDSSFDELRNTIEIGKENELVKAVSRKLRHLINVYDHTKNQMGILDFYTREYSRYDEYTDQQELVSLCADKERIAGKIEEMNPLVVNIMINIRECWKEKQKQPVERTLEEMQNIELVITSQYDLIKSYGDIARQSRELRDKLCAMYNKAIDNFYRQKIDDLDEKIKNTIDKSEKENLMSVRNMLKDETKNVLEQKEAKEYILMEALPKLQETYIENAAAESICSANRQILNNILGSAEEIMAHMIDSLYNLYYGPVTQNNFQLDENDLSFLERFIYKDKLLFRKPIEKYRLGLEMLNDGISPDVVRKELKYAASYTYKERTYSWPETDFRIKRPLPSLRPTAN